VALRVGLDLVAAGDVRAALRAHGDRYLTRVYTMGELYECRRGEAVDPERLAMCFAAKEATFKVLKVGDEAISWHDVEVRSDHLGRMDLLLSGRAANLARVGGIGELSLGITRVRGSAAAIVVARAVR
jgi:holo-[acyl-carrier protein] synthase